MKLRSLLTLSAALFSTSEASTILFDFGLASFATEGNWNHVDEDTNELAGLVDREGTVFSGMGLRIPDPSQIVPSISPGIPVPAQGAASSYPVKATWDFVLGSSLFPAIEFQLVNLTPGVEYSFSFFAFAPTIDLPHNREAEFTVTGSNSITDFLDSTDNTSDFARVFDITPDEDNEISIRVEAGPNNNQPEGFFYLSTMQVDFRPNAIPEPGTSFLLLMGGLSLMIRKRQS